jgi:putative transcriptional regulator
MTNKDLMKREYISRSTFYKIKKSENVTTEFLLPICAVLNCDISDIIKVVRNEDR